MGCKELIESLRKAADERIRLLWTEAEKEAEKGRAEVASKLGQLRENCSRTMSQAAVSAQAAAVSEAKNRSRTYLLKAETALAERLFSVGLSSLRRLRGDGYEEAFGNMARELPPLAWKTVRVNPDDVGLAKRIFSNAEIVPDKKIIGGMDAMTDSARIRVVNTLEKRLERAWVEMLPELLQEISAVAEPRP